MPRPPCCARSINPTLAAVDVARKTFMVSRGNPLLKVATQLKRPDGDYWKAQWGSKRNPAAYSEEQRCISLVEAAAPFAQGVRALFPCALADHGSGIAAASAAPPMSATFFVKFTSSCMRSWSSSTFQNAGGTPDICLNGPRDRHARTDLSSVPVAWFPLRFALHILVTPAHVPCPRAPSMRSCRDSALPSRATLQSGPPVSP